MSHKYFYLDKVNISVKIKKIPDFRKQGTSQLVSKSM